MTTSLHSGQGVGEIHIPYQWEYANQAARVGATGFVSTDVGKFARQLDDNSLWMLISVTPTWIGLGGIVEEAKSLVIFCRKATSGTIALGVGVYVTGYDDVNEVVLVEEAKADSSSTMPCIGVTRDEITDEATGVVVIMGLLDPVDTSSWSEGTQLYLSATAAGEFVTVRPVGAGSVIQLIGRVLRQDASNGVIEVCAAPPFSLPNLTTGKTWVGNADGIPVESTISTLSDTAPVNVTKDTASAGAATDASRRDHKHDITTAAASSVGTANAEGSATSLARSDHVHAGLKREAGDFATFTEKTVPALADLLLIEDSADSNAKKKAQVGNLPRKVIYGAEETEDTTGNTSWTESYRFSPTLEVAKYLVIFHYSIGGNGTYTHGRFQIDDSITVSEYEDYQYATEYSSNGGCYLFDCQSAGTHNFDFDFYTDSGPKVAAMRHKRVALIKVVE